MSHSSLSQPASSTPVLGACTSWCLVSKTSDFSDCDGVCFSEGSTVNLTIEAPDADENNVDVFVVREHEARAQVCVDKNQEPTLRMTVAEARQVIAGLQSALILADLA